MSPANELAEQGFHIGRNILSCSEMEALRVAAENVQRIAEQNPADTVSNYYLRHRPDQGALYDLYQRDPEFRRIAESPNLIRFLKDVIGEEFYLFENSMVYKPRRAENAVPWHQDFMYMQGAPDKAIVWIAIDDIDDSNGCLIVLPATHKNGALPGFEVKGEADHKRTDASFINEDKSMPVHMKGGDVLVSHQLLLHSSPKVTEDVTRRAFRLAVKRSENSYTPRGTPIVLSRSDEGGALLMPYTDAKSRHPTLMRLAQKLIRLGTRLEEVAA